MRSDNFVIVETSSNYNNNVGDIIINTSVEKVENINRVAKVIVAPEYTNLQEGDMVILHHNILRIQNDINGIERKSLFHIEDNKYWVPLEEILMVKESGEERWRAVDPFVFVKPIKVDDYKVGKYLISGATNSYKGMEKLSGKISFLNRGLENMGLKTGDKVYFTDYSEHEYNIGGELHYKMKTQDILLKSSDGGIK